MSAKLKCYRCGASLAELSLPLRRLEECPECTAELHVCRMCTHYAPLLPEACDEDDAPDVKEKARANFCDYFKPKPDAYTPGEQAAEAEAQAALGALFGEAPDTGGQQSRAGASGGDADAAGDPAAAAREAAEALFKK